MVMKTKRDKIKAVELSKTINQRKTNDIRKYNKKMIDETLNMVTSVKIARTLGIGRKQLYALKDL